MTEWSDNLQGPKGMSWVLKAEAEAKLAAEEDHSRILEIALDRCEDVLHGACDDKRVLIEKLAVAEAEIARLKASRERMMDEYEHPDGRDSGE